MKSLGLLGLITGLFLLISACGGYGDTSAKAPTSTVPQPTIPAAEPVSDGQLLFTNNGCGACHGSEGQGTGIAPGLAGHTAGQVKRQARAPLGQMPVFPPSKISNEELGHIAEYVESLGGDHLHMSVDNPGQALAQHHWMTLFALEDDSATEAIHHIDHIASKVTGQHLAQMKEAKEETEAGNIHDAIHIIENMLAGIQVEDLTPSEMQASLARSSVLVDDIEGALHHLDHLMEQMSGDPAVASQVAEIREYLEAGNIDGAAHELEELTGVAHEEEHEEEIGGHPH
ncbi:MAG: cytochrome c [SAR202 cluster bacterium]|nr:cytochrome c [SAR202 cluster bacterium]